MKYANHVAKSCPQILNWSATSTLRFTELQQIFLDSNLSLCSLLEPTLEECQQDYYKHLNKLGSVNGVPPEILSQPTTLEHDIMGELKDEDHLVEAFAYVVVAATMENKNKNDYSIPPSIENLWIEFMKFNYLKKELKEVNRKIDNLRQLLLDVKGQNESCAIDNTKFSKSGTKGKDIGMDFNSLDDKFETVMEDEEDENHDHIDVKTNTEEITDIAAAKKHIIGMEKDDDAIFYPIVDIAKLFDTPTVPGNFLVYEAREAFHKWLSLQQESKVDIDYLHANKEWFKSLVQHGSWLKDTHIDVAFYFFPKCERRWEKHAKKWNQFQMQANDILVDYVNGLHPIPSMKWSEMDIVYVPINVRRRAVILRVKNSGTLNSYMMFLNKSMKYLMHHPPFSSLTDARIDWFREKMATELFYLKNLPM
ncbi:hypothetical protein CK203_041447 [Vitis vinifera]|uniref:Ubiquitin-like protease family profile domain-containing protein n=1 Tax=Vitis vinifera TaxID=29760 RepID=A0A438HNK4_VITVI|nr:hypothetical protein CK203_041447 [Vitis vinifera]